MYFYQPSSDLQTMQQVYNNGQLSMKRTVIAEIFDALMDEGSLL